MKKHPLLSNLILTMAIQIGVYLIIIFELQIIEPILQSGSLYKNPRKSVGGYHGHAACTALEYSKFSPTS